MNALRIAVDGVLVGPLCHINSIHLLTLLKSVAVALLIVCAVLAASRVW